MLSGRAAALQQEISNLYLQFPELIEDEPLRADMLEGATDINELLTAIAIRIGKVEEYRDGCKLHLDKVKARHTRLTAHVEFLRALIAKILQHAALKKVVLPIVTLSMHPGQPKLLGSTDPDALPDDLCKITREPDLMKIKEHLQEGGVVQGYALSNAEPHLVMYPR